MILKHYELNEDQFKKNNFFLLYGNNEGLKKELINRLINKNNNTTYDEKELLENENNFIESIMSKSLFDEKKIIIIKRCTDKILKIIEKIKDRNIQEITLILNSNILEKRSKLRNFFEKEKNLICTAFYPDNQQTLLNLTNNFLKQKKISISTENINIIINKSNGDREKLISDLTKIEFFEKNGKKIGSKEITKLINLTENYDVSKLIDNCLAKNKKKTISILNENNFSSDDSILIVRTLLNKAKKLIKLSAQYENNNSIDLTISSAKPPIFWKDKEITKQQIAKWTSKDIKNLIYKINEIELVIKKNLNNSINLIINFIFEEVFS